MRRRTRSGCTIWLPVARSWSALVVQHASHTGSCDEPLGYAVARHQWRSAAIASSSRRRSRLRSAWCAGLVAPVTMPAPSVTCVCSAIPARVGGQMWLSGWSRSSSCRRWPRCTWSRPAQVRDTPGILAPCSLTYHSHFNRKEDWEVLETDAVLVQNQMIGQVLTGSRPRARARTDRERERARLTDLSGPASAPVSRVGARRPRPHAGSGHGRVVFNPTLPPSPTLPRASHACAPPRQ